MQPVGVNELENELFIPVNQPLLNGNEKKYLSECIDSGWISSEGPFVGKFERLFSSRVERKYGVAVTNGTAALDLAFEALGIVAGDEVIIPAFTIISCIHFIVRAGAVPVLVDCDPFTYNMDVNSIEEKITSKTKAILMVHIYGLPVDVDRILEIAQKYELKVVEDTAEAIGLTYKGRPCGSFGDVSTFSFYPNKHVTTGEGGMICTNSLDLADKCRSLRNLCFQPDRRFVHEELGWNLRLTSLQAAVGLAQLERLDEFIAIKMRMGKRYNELLNGLPHIQLPIVDVKYSHNIYWVYGLVIDSDVPIVAEDVIQELHKRGVGARPFFCSIASQPVLNKMGLFKGQKFPVSENLYKKGFYIPSGLATSDEQMTIVSKNLWEIFEGV